MRDFDVYSDVDVYSVKLGMPGIHLLIFFKCIQVYVECRSLISIGMVELHSDV